jgi:hypothetical protein
LAVTVTVAVTVAVAVTVTVTVTVTVKVTVTIDTAGAVVAGGSFCYAHLSDQHTDPKPAEGGSTTLVAWVRVEGYSRTLLGAASAGIDRTEPMTRRMELMDFSGQPFWGFHLRSRSIYRRGERVRGGRGRGPDEFELSCTLRLTIDSSAGTLSIAIAGGDDLGVVVDQLPTDEPLHLAVGTCDHRCRVTLLESDPTGTAELCIRCARVRVFLHAFALHSCLCVWGCMQTQTHTQNKHT